jgi:mannose-1-phosphate guanylyltransferase/mannose-6-phosphate isomerase
MSKHAVIMAGGNGTRLWPLSRKDTPKQFQKFTGDKSLIQQTFERIKKVVPPENIWVVTGENHITLVQDQIPEITHSHIITEPMGRNTAAATCLAATRIMQEDPDALIFGLLPADHHIGKEDVFIKTIKTIFLFLEKNTEYVATIGINPTEPNTGLGYIKMGEQLDKINNQKIFTVESFHEKPDLKTAQEFLEQWEYLWNGGYYLFQGKQFLKYCATYIPETLEKIARYVTSPSAELYGSIISEPIDKAIAEKLDKLAVVPVDMDWSDIGNWATLHEILGEGEQLQQVSVGNHLGIDTDTSFIFGREKLIATVGLKNIVVIETDDAILIADRNSVQDVKKVVEKLEEQGKHDYL